MRNKIFAFALACGTLAVRAGDGNFLTLRLQDGTEMSIPAVAGLKITFADGSFVAENRDGRQQFPLTALQSMRFTETSTGISQIGVDAKDAVFHDLSGRRVCRPVSGLYIVKEGNVARKVLKR